MSSPRIIASADHVWITRPCEPEIDLDMRIVFTHGDQDAALKRLETAYNDVRTQIESTK